MPYSYTGNIEHGARKAFLTGLSIITSFAVLLSASLREPTVLQADCASEPIAEPEPHTVAADTFGVMFILRSVDGKVAVLNSIETAILEILDISVSALPEPYADELEGGVIIGSVTELVSVLSEYQSFT